MVHKLLELNYVVIYERKIKMHVQSSQVPKPQPRSKMTPPDNLPELPSVPSDIIAGGASRHDTSDEIDFDDLARRFEELKKRQ